jgi:hypothetical protein
VHKGAQAGYSWILAASLAGDKRGDEYLSTLREQLHEEQLEQATRRAQELQAVQRSGDGNRVRPMKLRVVDTLPRMPCGEAYRLDDNPSSQHNR